MWLVRALAAEGHSVSAIFRQRPEGYADDLRRRRVALAAEACTPIHGVSFGDPNFLAIAKEGGWDLLAHHAADVTNYRSADFDFAAALASNTRSLAAMLEALRAGGCRRVILT